MATVAETQQQLYNDVMDMCEERHVLLTENRKPRFLLDSLWNGGGINACLEEADWGFARRTQQIQYDPSIQPPFGYIRAFKKPPDWLRTSAISSDPYFNSVFTQYGDEAGYWFSDRDTIYVKYVSGDVNYGNNLTLWTEAFKQFTASHFAEKIVGSITHDKSVIQKVEALRKRLLTSARGKDSMNEPPGFFSRGQLSRARQGLYFGRPDRVGSSWY